jgi:glycerophosphoryl diester phosphodiesterase
MPRPEIIAHRGTPREHPENSLPGFARALALGVDGIELDVQLTGDRVPVVHHDAVLGRPGVGGPLDGRAIAELTRAALRTHELAPGVGVPTLHEVLDLVGDRATLYVEVKAANAASAVARVLAGAGARAPVHAFDHRVPRAVRALAPDTPIGLLAASYLLDTGAVLQSAGARDWWPHREMVDADLVGSVHAAGGRVIVWTVNDPAEAVALAAIGVDGLCSDVPEVVAAALATAGLRASPPPTVEPARA